MNSSDSSRSQQGQYPKAKEQSIQQPVSRPVLPTQPEMDITLMSEEEREFYLLDARTQQRDLLRQKVPDGYAAYDATIEIQEIIKKIDLLTDDCNELRERQYEALSLIRKKNAEIQDLMRQKEAYGRLIKHNRQEMLELNKPLQNEILRRQKALLPIENPLEDLKIED
jgi:hypothetical protein